MDEPFGPEYVRPPQQDCSRCGCCTTELCERGRNSLSRCAGHAPKDLREFVYGCPCSAATTKHTASWRMEQVRVTKMARELPLRPEAALLLRALAAGEDVQDLDNLAPQLKVHGLAQIIDLRPAITELGRTYLAAADDRRFTTPVEVLSVDAKQRTAQVVVVGWHMREPVTVLLDHLITSTGLGAEELPGVFLEAEANCYAETADELVLTRVRVAPPLPSGWMGIGGDAE
ncbi:hypothetical protein ACFRFL_13845 [Streptomyces sp. NPDC056708]|uniref:hypothetical protein n=1 Tax=unclassified Streptomyces TaxID=2593676 RepID=UPI0036A4B3A3